MVCLNGKVNLALDFTLEIRQHTVLPTLISRCLRSAAVGGICLSTPGNAHGNDHSGINRTQVYFVVDVLPKSKSDTDT